MAGGDVLNPLQGGDRHPEKKKNTGPHSLDLARGTPRIIKVRHDWG